MPAQAAPPAPADPPPPQSFLEETAEHWERRYANLPRAELERELAELRQQFVRQSAPEFERLLDKGPYEFVEGATEPGNEP